MSNSSLACLGQRNAVILRATRLESDCTPSTGSDDTWVTAAIVAMQTDLDVEDGTTYELKSANNEFIVMDKDDDIVKRLMISSLEIGAFDVEGFELLSNGSVLTADTGTTYAGKHIGYAAEGPGTAHKNGIALEMWVKTADTAGRCGPAGTKPPYVRYVFPFLKLRPNGPGNFANEVKTQTFVGWGAPNPSFGEGPYGDWPLTTGLPVTAPYVWFYSDGTDLPVAVCGYQFSGPS